MVELLQALEPLETHQMHRCWYPKQENNYLSFKDIYFKDSATMAVYTGISLRENNNEIRISGEIFHFYFWYWFLYICKEYSLYFYVNNKLH